MSFHEDTEDRPKTRHVALEYFVVRDVDDNYAPNDKPVLRVSMIGSDLVSLQICDAKEDGKGWTLTTKEEIVVDAEPLFAGLNAFVKSMRTKGCH